MPAPRIVSHLVPSAPAPPQQADELLLLTPHKNPGGSVMSQQPHSGRFANDTPITQMVSPNLASTLAPYERLTKSDLLAMAGLSGEGVTPPEQFGITQQDLRRIKDVFAAEQEIQGLDEVS